MLASENNSGSAEKQARQISPEFAQVSFPKGGVCSIGWRFGASPVAGAGSITWPISTSSSGSHSARNSRFPTTPAWQRLFQLGPELSLSSWGPLRSTWCPCSSPTSRRATKIYFE